MMQRILDAEAYAVVVVVLPAGGRARRAPSEPRQQPPDIADRPAELGDLLEEMFQLLRQLRLANPGCKQPATSQRMQSIKGALAEDGSRVVLQQRAVRERRRNHL